MYAFDYHRPSSVAEAARLLASSQEGKLLAGGHTLLPTMKLRLAGPKHLIDLGRISELRGIERRGGDLHHDLFLLHCSHGRDRPGIRWLRSRAQRRRTHRHRS